MRAVSDTSNLSAAVLGSGDVRVDTSACLPFVNALWSPQQPHPTLPGTSSESNARLHPSF